MEAILDNQQYFVVLPVQNLTYNDLKVFVASQINERANELMEKPLKITFTTKSNVNAPIDTETYFPRFIDCLRNNMVQSL